MREIKFRAWDKDYEKMREWGYVKNLDTVFFEDADFVWMQYTGLKDKNGKEIYEGDIVKVDKLPYDENGIGQVIWDKKKLGFFYQSIRDIWTSNTSYYYRLSGKTVEVIGNIYENPELLDKYEVKERGKK